EEIHIELLSGLVNHLLVVRVDFSTSSILKIFLRTLLNPFGSVSFDQRYYVTSLSLGASES
ncbi:MAG: hypothetical protein AAB393_05880, partial [Bacteroidota bacterium]